MWWSASTRQLRDALPEAGPDRGCWTWWAGSQSPQTCGAVARHQLYETAPHTYDARIAPGAPGPLPDGVALDGVDESLSACCATTAPGRTSPPPSSATPPRAAPGAWRSPPGHGP
ncbi:hypothetical protein GCM10010300_52950 [Streptomyces olivaceoviridis]|uniref:maleylpyruvate isomerase N-terminal domain-containing protein n=1 Tax=Streptomyces olivaceoviridis TaxID=1921 RepID=UPI0019B3FC68|nr:maleylpyruvate isomerase N-terminal domain-containing protein [Streptomyces olivaceoviridis]GGZ02401.1 hypothetical protein GCM10010300_52950 [Streptomyces olivaceoviridis]